MRCFLANVVLVCVVLQPHQTLSGEPLNAHPSYDVSHNFGQPAYNYNDTSLLPIASTPQTSSSKVRQPTKDRAHDSERHARRR